ncbi:hypothetical protein [Streptomyces sp. NPDC047070]|uniref:hypothetical protein n=1 Tax=Streptomyces sp. NPDC047070 TaxID=3154923 RepID=UPI003452FEA0
MSEPSVWRVFGLILGLGEGVAEVVDRASLWGPLAVAAVLAITARPLSDSVRTRARTLSALVRLDDRPNAPTCTDTCPDTSVDMRPDMSGHRSTGGC